MRPRSHPPRGFRRVSTFGRSDLPNEPGHYEWWFSESPFLPSDQVVEPRWYVGIASRSLRQRIAGCHLGGSHRNSTLRLSLRALLGRKKNRPVTERELNDWLQSHAYVRFCATRDFGAIEKASIPQCALNIRGNSAASAIRLLRQVRSEFRNPGSTR